MRTEGRSDAASAAKRCSRAQWHLSDRCSKSDSVRFELGALRGYGTEGECDASPLVLVGCRAWQMQHDAAHGALDAGAELQEPLTQGRHLRTRQACAGRTAAQLLHEQVSRGGQQDAQLNGEEARTAGAGGLRTL